MWLKDTHSTISVSNMEKSLAFYRDLLGMKVRVEPKLYQPDESMDKIFNMKGASFYYAQLDYDDSYVIEILEWVSPRARIPATPNANDLGFHWQCIYQTDVEGTYRRLKAAGVKFVSEPVMLGGGTIPDVFCLDPDGNWVEIHAPPPGGTAASSLLKSGWGKETHTTITVSNIQKSLVFYRDLLGMKVRLGLGSTPYKPTPEMDKIFNMNDVSFWVAQLGYEDTYLVELLEWVPQSPRPQRALEPNDVGFHWQCIYQTDVEGTYRRLKAAGVKFVSEPVMLGGGTIPDVFCLDPDGNWVEIHPPRQ